MNKFLSAIKNKIVWIVIGIIAILVGPCLYEILSPPPVLNYPKPPSAVLQIQSVEQEGYACVFGPQGSDNFLGTAKTSNKALITSSLFSAALKFTVDEPPQAMRIQALDATALGKPTEASYGEESYFIWKGGCFADNANVTLTKDLDLKNMQIFTLELKRGLYVINVSTKWARIGWVIYAFLVEVK
jgi:hypothetical protein